MSGDRQRAAYQHNQPEFGAPGIVLVNATNSPTFYQCKPSDFLVLVDLASYGAGPGPDIRFAPYFEAYPLTIRNINGSGATANWSVTAPASLTGGFEDPTNPTNFDSSIPITIPNFEAMWVLDRARSRLVLLDPDFTGGGGAPQIFNGTTSDSTAHTLHTVALAAPPSDTLIDVKWIARDTTDPTSGGGGNSQGVFAASAAGGGTATQLSTTAVLSAKGGGSIGFTTSNAPARVNIQGTGDGALTNWTLYVTLFPNTT